MARYHINEEDGGISIELTEIGRHQDELLQAFDACQAGSCAYPTNEYQKLETMEIHQDGETVRLQLGSRPGERFDAGEIAACLDYSAAQVASLDPEERAPSRAAGAPAITDLRL